MAAFFRAVLSFLSRSKLFFLSTAVVSEPSSSETEKSQPDKKFILIFTNFKSLSQCPCKPSQQKIRAPLYFFYLTRPIPTS